MVAYITGTEDPRQRNVHEQLGNVFSARFKADLIDGVRFRECAESNGTTFDAPVKLGRAIMLSGPDWHGVFDLGHQGSRDAFDEELNRALKKRTQQP